MYTLYYSPGACSMAVHVLLHELGEGFELKSASIKEGKNKDPEFLKLNPRGQVPLLIDDGLPIREGGAILVYLCDKYKSLLLPESGRERARALEWLMFGNATLHPAYARVFFLKKNNAPDALLNTALDNVQKLWDDVEAQLAKHTYLCGDHRTVGDILVTVIANWNGMLPRPMQFGPHTKRLLKSISALPSYQKALASEHVEYKAAA